MHPVKGDYYKIKLKKSDDRAKRIEREGIGQITEVHGMISVKIIHDPIEGYPEGSSLFIKNESLLERIEGNPLASNQNASALLKRSFPPCT